MEFYFYENKKKFESTPEIAECIVTIIADRIGIYGNKEIKITVISDSLMAKVYEEVYEEEIEGVEGEGVEGEDWHVYLTQFPKETSEEEALSYYRDQSLSYLEKFPLPQGNRRAEELKKKIENSSICIFHRMIEENMEDYYELEADIRNNVVSVHYYININTSKISYEIVDVEEPPKNDGNFLAYFLSYTWRHLKEDKKEFFFIHKKCLELYPDN